MRRSPNKLRSASSILRLNGGGVEKEKKISFAIFGRPSLKEGLDNCMRKNGFKCRADTLEYLLNMADGVSSTSSPAKGIEKLGTKNIQDKEKSTAKKRQAKMSPKKNALNGPKSKKWLKKDIAKLQVAVGACKPQGDADWEEVAEAIGGEYSADDCRKCAQLELQYNGNGTSEPIMKQTRKMTLMQRQARDEVLPKIVKDRKGNKGIPSISGQAHKVVYKIDQLGFSDVSELSTPASAVSRHSRFGLDYISEPSTPVNKNDTTVIGVTASAKRRANRYIHQLQADLTKAVTAAKKKLRSPALKAKTKCKNRRISKEIHAIERVVLKKKTHSVETDEEEGEGDKDEYFSDSDNE